MTTQRGMRIMLVAIFMLVAILLAGCNVAKDQHDAVEAASRIHQQFTNGDFTLMQR